MGLLLCVLVNISTELMCDWKACVSVSLSVTSMLEKENSYDDVLCIWRRQTNSFVVLH